jgi:hypothetical protein
MKINIELSAFVLLIIGTLGLLINAFVFDWGRTATLIFAAANVIGLLAFGFTYWSKKQDT